MFSNRDHTSWWEAWAHVGCFSSSLSFMRISQPGGSHWTHKHTQFRGCGSSKGVNFFNRSEVEYVWAVSACHFQFALSWPALVGCCKCFPFLRWHWEQVLNFSQILSRASSLLGGLLKRRYSLLSQLNKHMKNRCEPSDVCQQIHRTYIHWVASCFVVHGWGCDRLTSTSVNMYI